MLRPEPELSFCATTTAPACAGALQTLRDFVHESLAKAAALIEANWLGPARDDLGPSWHDWLIARLLLRQAQALIEDTLTEEKP